VPRLTSIPRRGAADLGDRSVAKGWEQLVGQHLLVATSRGQLEFGLHVGRAKPVDDFFERQHRYCIGLGWFDQAM
jgi:hypothetical protein